MSPMFNNSSFWRLKKTDSEKVTDGVSHEVSESIQSDHESSRFFSYYTYIGSVDNRNTTQGSVLFREVVNASLRHTHDSNSTYTR